MEEGKSTDDSAATKLPGFAFHFVEIIYHMEIQSAFCLYPQNSLQFFNQTLKHFIRNLCHLVSSS